jgi:23S rRNA (uracil1939-C5)-methyltransferase
MNTDVFTVHIERIVTGGAGLGHIEGKSVFVEGTAPGELARCRISEEHSSWAKAELLDIIEASPERVTPACPLYGVCGGCNLQHLRYEAQLAVKVSILKENFARNGGRNGGCEPPEIEALPSPAWEYRNRMQLRRVNPAALRAKGRQKTRAGFGLKARHSGEVTAVADCPVADPKIRELLRKSAAGERLIFPPPGKDRFTVYARDGLLLSEGGTQRGRVRLLDKEIVLDAEVFFQSNGVMLEKLIAGLQETAVAARRAADEPGPAMADIFCGVGTFAAFLGGLFSRADLIEENRAAIALARENLGAAHGLHSGPAVEFFALRDEDWARNYPGHYAFIVADPPRTGLGASLARRLAAEGPPTLAYVSCDPATLARDSRILVSGGYTLASLKLYDFYPQTSHIESLAVFHKNQNR